MIFNLKTLSIYSTKAIKEKKVFSSQRFYSLKPGVGGPGGESTTISTIVYKILNNSSSNKMTTK